jgi:hypothetical protein
MTITNITRMDLERRNRAPSTCGCQFGEVAA